MAGGITPLKLHDRSLCNILADVFIYSYDVCNFLHGNYKFDVKKLAY